MAKTPIDATHEPRGSREQGDIIPFMKKFLQYLNHENTAALGCILVLVGMVYGKFILSVGSLLLISRAVINPQILNTFRRLFRRPDFMAIVGVFFLYGISGFWSADLGFWADRMKMKLPFIGMPVAFLAIQSFDNQWFNRLMSFFFWMMVITSAGALGWFLIDLENMMEAYSKGQVMLLPAQHVRYSLMVVLAICLGVEFLRKRVGFFDFLRSGFSHFREMLIGGTTWSRAANELSRGTTPSRPTSTETSEVNNLEATPFTVKEKKWLIGGIIFLIIFLHILAVRSGLMAFYVIVLFYGFRFLLSENKLIGTSLIFLVVAGGILSYFFVPTLKNKIDYTYYSVRIFERNMEMRDLSDSRRIGSVMAGLHLAKAYPILGTGVGDIKHKCEEWYMEHYPDLHNLGLMPHNQFIFVLAAFGWLGLVFFLAMLAMPFFYESRWKDPLFITFNITLLTSFLVEHTLETQLGIAVYIFPIIMLMRKTVNEQRETKDEQRETNRQ